MGNRPTTEELVQNQRDQLFQDESSARRQVESHQADMDRHLASFQQFNSVGDRERAKMAFSNYKLSEKARDTATVRVNHLSQARLNLESTHETADLLTNLDKTNKAIETVHTTTKTQLGVRPEAVVDRMRVNMEKTQNMNAVLAKTSNEFMVTSTVSDKEMDEFQAELSRQERRFMVQTMPNVATTSPLPVVQEIPSVAQTKKDTDLNALLNYYNQ